MTTVVTTTSDEPSSVVPVISLATTACPRADAANLPHDTDVVNSESKDALPSILLGSFPGAQHIDSSLKRPVCSLDEPSETLESKRGRKSMHVVPVVFPCSDVAKGKLISDCICIELAAGAAGFSRALSNLGFQAIPIDHAHNRHSPKMRCIRIDLTTVGAYDLLNRIFETEGQL